MTIKIVYTDFNDNILTPQQLAQTQNFIKEVYIDNIIKSREDQLVLSDGKRYKNLGYFLDDNTEDKDVIAQNYCSVENNASCVVRYNRQFLNGYSLWTLHNYNDEGNSLGDGGQEVYDRFNRCIYASSYVDNTTQIYSVSKIMYPQSTDNFESKALIHFYFHRDSETGLMDLSISDADDNYHMLMPQDFTIEFLQSEGLWDEYPYYHSHLPIIPEPGTI